MLTKCLIIVVLLCLLVAATPRAQDRPKQLPASQSSVALSMIVTDQYGKGVNSIRKDQVRVVEGKSEQTILSIDVDERPVDLVLLIDATGSFKLLIESAIDAAKLFILNRRPDDQIAIARFVSSDKIENVQEFTTDNKALTEALDQIYLELGQSAVIDALYIGADYVEKHNKDNQGRRKVVAIITDGEDRNSYYKREQLIKLLHETGTQVFILGLVVDLKGSSNRLDSPRARAENFLKTIAQETGGRVFFPANKEQLAAAAGEIILNLRAQFRISYQSTQSASKTGFRKVDVKFVSTDGEKLNLITPPGYYVGLRSSSAKSEKK